jgi:redox-sensing transcriptional repressor
MSDKRLPDVVVRRLSLYLRELRILEKAGSIYVSSAKMAEALNFSAAQVRRDLSSCGQLGTSGRGYDIRRLYESLQNMLGLSECTWPVALAGVGNLGSALLAYGGFQDRGFLFHAAFDADLNKVGQSMHGLTVQPVIELERVVAAEGIRIGIIAVPAEQAQDVCDAFLNGGVSSIVNFAPVQLTAPAQFDIRNVDLSLELEQLTYHLVHDLVPRRSA